MTAPQKPKRRATAIVGTVRTPSRPFREASRFRETVPVGLPRTPRPLGRGFSSVPCRSVAVVASRFVLRVYGATRTCPRRPRPTWRLGDSRDHREVEHPGNRSGRRQAPADRSRSRGVRRVSGVVQGARHPGLTPACWRFLFALAGLLPEGLPRGRTLSFRHRPGRLLLSPSWLGRTATKGALGPSTIHAPG